MGASLFQLCRLLVNARLEILQVRGNLLFRFRTERDLTFCLCGGELLAKLDLSGAERLGVFRLSRGEPAGQFVLDLVLDYFSEGNLTTTLWALDRAIHIVAPYACLAVSPLGPH